MHGPGEGPGVAFGDVWEKGDPPRWRPVDKFGEKGTEMSYKQTNKLSEGLTTENQEKTVIILHTDSNMRFFKYGRKLYANAPEQLWGLC